MTTFQDLIITGQDLKIFVEKFESFVKETFVEKWIINNHDDVFFVENTEENATVCLVYQNYETRNKLEVTNVIPTEKHALSVEKYNKVLTDFYNEVINKFSLEKQLKINVEKTSGEMALEDIFGKPAARMLRVYCKDIKGSSLEQIQDYSYTSREWFDFILTSFTTGFMCYNTPEFKSYLNELLENEELSNFLALEYERTITFLSYYEGEYKINKGRE